MTRLVTVVIAALLCAPSSGHAEAWSGTVPAKARALAERGRSFHDAGDYAHAIAAFTQAYAMAPSPALLFNLAQAYRLQGACDDAVVMYERYLATDPGSEGRTLAESHLATVERCAHKLALHIPLETVASRLIVPPAPDAPVLRGIAGGPSHTAAVEKAVGTGLMLGGAASVAIAVYYSLQAHSATSDVAAAYAAGGRWRDIAPIDQRGRSAASSAVAFGVGGVLGIASGIAMYAIGRHTESAPMTLSASSHGVAVSARWRF